MPEQLINFDRIHWQFKPVFGATEQLSANIAALNSGDIPESVTRACKTVLLDSIACMMKGRDSNVSAKLESFIKMEGGRLESTCLSNNAFRSNRYNSSLYNGTLMTASGCDVVFRGMHCASVIVPAVLSVAEKELIEGNRIKVALATGLEVMLRLMAAAKTVPENRALDPTSTFGPFGSAAAVSKILDLDAFETENALSLCASQAAGAQRSAVLGDGDVGYMHGGFASSYGIRAVFLSRKGLSGPRNILEGNMGFFECVSGLHDDNKTPRYDSTLVNEGFGEKWLLLDLRVTCAKGDSVKASDAWDVVCEKLNGVSSRSQRKIAGIIDSIEDMDSLLPLISVLSE
ncbi:MAG: MmgE/PrpD family protein [Spirochaetales bacterium]|nr:MmgE/PrpD family protein [Spirochaetales bacterium]